MAKGVLLDPFNGAVVENHSGLPTEDILRSIREDEVLMAQFTQWTGEARGGTSSFGPGYGSSSGGFGGGGAPRIGGLFERDRYVTPYSTYAQMRLAYDAVEADDVVGGVADTSEALAFSRVSFYAQDKDEEDIYNQVAADLDLDSRLREMWRELFTCSQFYCAVWWGNKTYSVRGQTDKGNARRKSFNIRVPEAITLLDPLKVVPVGSTLFNKEQLAYVASRDEAELFDDPDTRVSDPIFSRLFLGRYSPTAEDVKWIGSEDHSSDHLFLLNPETVFRHTLTRPQFRRLAPVRMRSVFELLDLKHQLRSMDRAHLIGGTNFIVLIKKGTDAMPGKPVEIAHLQNQVKTIARLPVLVGDHRLSVEIVTPKLDSTLNGDRYSTLDARITARLYGMFVMGGQSRSVGTTNDDSSSLVKVIARGIESRRHMIQRSLEKHIFGPVFQRNDALTTAAKLKFHPKSIDLGFDSALATFLMDLRQSNELSRETLLSQFDLDQDDEARMLEREEESYDKIFQTQVPFSSPNPRNPDSPQDPAAPATTPAEKRRAGRQGGGNRNGGGAAPGSGQGQPPSNPRRTSD